MKICQKPVVFGIFSCPKSQNLWSPCSCALKKRLLTLCLKHENRENGIISRITQPYIIREYPVIRKILFGRISEVFVFEPYSICIIRIRTVFDFLVLVASLPFTYLLPLFGKKLWTFDYWEPMLSNYWAPVLPCSWSEAQSTFVPFFHQCSRTEVWCFLVI